MVRYIRFHPDLWTTIFNYEAIGVVTSISDDAMAVTGHFRTQADYIGLKFSSSDFWNHGYVKYDKNNDYSKVKLSFTAAYDGELGRFDDTELQPAAIFRIGENEGNDKFLTLGMFGVKNNGTDTFKFDGEIKLSNTWIDVSEPKLSWTYTDEEGNLSQGSGKLVDDYDMDFVRGIFYTREGQIPYMADVTLDYTYNTHEKFTIDFDQLFEGVHPALRTTISPTNIQEITIPVIPSFFVEGDLIMTGRSDSFQLKIEEMVIENGELNEIPAERKKVPYRLAEGFDDEYNKNPKRLIESMRLLGYDGIINFYIGASHFYDKKGKAREISTGVGDIYLDDTAGINDAFRTWLESYLYHMSLNGFTNIVISVSMECLQMPESWKQRLHNGQPGATGWNPPTNFYSPNVDAVKEYIDIITCETLDLVVAAGFKPILQLGESWYWWQEFQPGDVNSPYEGRPPAFYDKGTMDRFKREMGYDLPVYQSSDIHMTWKNREVAEKLRQYLGEFTDFMRTIADKYFDSEFTTLFFPPSVLDKARTPEMLTIVNAPFEYWSYPKLDFIQIEDYDWVTREVEDHKDVYTQAWYDMGYPFSKQHYFAGFVLKAEDADKEWKLIERAAQEALGRRYAEVFIWAGTQIRRDSWNPKRNTYVSDTENWLSVNMDQLG
ncbi:non-contractile tail sheath protein [Terribacillus saccharophilus]|uniref:non-contractile tail sheath protein n=1 Tax=Terribacillus saccharophilus TaxID=361277 RepID=UPI002DC70090|nr:hypothetical protein [Terribacillus saccharophilus]MEC0288910.1 hypothetical protein [Terribacillus saccharophilus]